MTAAHKTGSGGTETILVAEDEEMVKSLLEKVLAMAGYTVITAANGEEAVAMLREYSDVISLVLSDVVMPKLNGNKIQEEINRIRPETRLIFMSGYASDIVRKKGIRGKRVLFMAKPLLKNDLLQKVREVLDGK